MFDNVLDTVLDFIKNGITCFATWLLSYTCLIRYYLLVPSSYNFLVVSNKSLNTGAIDLVVTFSSRAFLVVKLRIVILLVKRVVTTHFVYLALKDIQGNVFLLLAKSNIVTW